MQSDPSIPDIEDLKKEFYLIVAYIRRIHKNNFDFGTIGEEGGIDGEITSRVMYPIHEIISRETTFHDVNRYGIDIGHGSGMAMLAHFNYHGKINMVGAEFNEYRANLSWNFQQILSRHEDKQMQRISKMSIFFQGDATEVLPRELGVNPLFAFLVYWFRHGWNDKDTDKMVGFLNSFLNLEWLITDLTRKMLLRHGFKGTFVGESRKFSGSLVQSSCSRTLHVHHLQRKSVLTPGEKFVCSAPEGLIIGNFESTTPLRFAESQMKQLEQSRLEAKKNRKIRQKIVKTETPLNSVFRMASFKSFLSKSRRLHLHRQSFSFREQQSVKQGLEPKKQNVYRRQKVIRVTSKLEDRRASDPAYVAHVEMRSSFLSSSKLEYRRADDPAYVAHVERVSSFLSFLSGKKYGKLIRKFKPFQSF